MDAVSRILTQVLTVLCTCDAQRLRESCWAGAEEGVVLGAATLAHDGKALSRLQCAQQHKTVSVRRFHQHVGEPVHPVIQIDIGAACLVVSYELASGGSKVCVARLIAFFAVGFRFYYAPRALSPTQLTAQQIAGTFHWMTTEK